MPAPGRVEPVVGRAVVEQPGRGPVVPPALPAAAGTPAASRAARPPRSPPTPSVDRPGSRGCRCAAEDRRAPWSRTRVRSYSSDHIVGPARPWIMTRYTFDKSHPNRCRGEPMTTHTSETSTGRALRPPRAGRSNGQWAVDGREPLNANEAWKQEDGGLNVRAADRAGLRQGGLRLHPARRTCSGRFRWWGLYTQRKPGIDGGRTAQLDDTELSDEYFMLRVRLDGGALTLAQLRVLADLSHDFARGTADISDRQNIQYHWIRVEDVPEIWRRLEAVGLQTTEACGDTPRVILGSPLAGIAADEIIDPTPADRRDHPPLHRRPRARQPPAQVQVGDHRAPQPRRRARDQRHLAGRGRAPRAGRRLRPLGGRRAVHGAAPGRAARRVRRPGAGRRRVARRHLDLPRLRLPPDAHQGAPEVPHGRVGPGEVPRGARDRVPRPRPARRPSPGAGDRPRRPRRRAPAEGRPATTSAPPRSSAGSAATCSPGSPT